MRVQKVFDQLIQQPVEESTGPPGRVYRAHTRVIPRREVIAPHFHADLEMVLFADVACETRVDGAVYRMRGDGVQYVAPGAIHSYELQGLSAQSRVWVAQLNFEYFRACIARHDPQRASALARRIANCPVRVPADAGPFEELLPHLCGESTQESETQLAATLGALYGLLGALAACAPGTAVARPRAPAHALMNTVASFADRAVSLDAIARACGLSRFHLCRVFKRHTGMSVGEYLTRMRILRAQQLLMNGRSVTRACFESGFNSVSYFIVVFTRIAGSTPKQWVLEQHAQR